MSHGSPWGGWDTLPRGLGSCAMAVKGCRPPWSQRNGRPPKAASCRSMPISARHVCETRLVRPHRFRLQAVGQTDDSATFCSPLRWHSITSPTGDGLRHRCVHDVRHPPMWTRGVPPANHAASSGDAGTNESSTTGRLTEIHAD